MVITLYGPDGYRRKEKKDFFVTAFIKKYGAHGVAFYDGEDDDALARIEEATRTQSMFESHKMLVIEHPFALTEKSFKKLLEEVLPSKLTTLVLLADKKPLKLFSFLLDEPAVGFEYELLKGAAWSKFVVEEAKARGVSLTSVALAFLAEAYTGDSFRLATELDKLASSPKKQIAVTDLEEAGIEIAPDFWALVNGLRAHDAGTRLGLLERALSRGEEPAKLFNILSSLAKDKVAAFANYDYAVKSGKLEYDDALLDFVLG